MLDLYRSFQLLHHMTTKLVSFVLPTVLPATEFLVISAVYVFIRIFQTPDVQLLQPLSIVMIALLALLILNLAISFAVNVTQASWNFVDVGHRTDIPKCKYINRYLNSCQSLNWKIGGTFTLRRDTFPDIMHRVIIDILINLLLVF